MQVKRVILFVVISVLSIFMLTGCPPQDPLPGDNLSAKEIWDIIEPVGETLGDDVVPVYIIGMGISDYRILDEGKGLRWTVGFYSEEQKVVWEVPYASYLTKDGTTPKPGAAEIFYSDASLTAADLADWKIDSPEAYDIAVQHGAGEATSMVLQFARLGSLYDGLNGFYNPDLIPETTGIFWLIVAGDAYYVDACTGEYLGSNTVEEVNDIRKEAQYTPVS